MPMTDIKHIKTTARRIPVYPSFNDMSVARSSALYNIANVKLIQINETLFKKSESKEDLYIVLNGTFNIIDISCGSRESVMAVSGIKAGGCPDVISYISPSIYAVAETPAKVLVINPATLIALDDKTRMILLAESNRFTVKIFRRLQSQKTILALRNRRLQEKILYQQTQAVPTYKENKLIQDIIRKIPHLPVFFSNLTEKLHEHDISLQEISKLVQKDPSMTANVLKVVNSPYYGFKNQIADIHQAVILIGLNELYHIVFSIGLQQTMPKTENFLNLFNHSSIISRIAFEISLTSQVGNPAQLRTIGLLHDLGESVILLLKKQYPKLSFLIDGLEKSFLGAILLKRWKLPEIICDTVGYQSYPDFTDPKRIPEHVRINITILYFAHLCYEVITGDFKPEIDRIELEPYKKILRWENRGLEDITTSVLIPKLVKNLNSYPLFFRKLLLHHS